jgi:MFS transporter, CP family, cyanate transporter
MTRPPDSDVAASAAERVLTRRVRLLMAAWALLVALNLRPPVASLGPVLFDLRTDLGLSRGLAGLLTTLPVLCFGLLAPLAGRVGRRLGLELALAGSVLVLAAGILVRSAGPFALVLAGTVVVGAGTTVGNVLVPALIKRHFPAALGVMTALFTAALTSGAALAGGLTGVVAESAGWSWRLALAVWAVPCVVAAVVWLPLRPYRAAGPDAVPSLSGGGSVWRAPRAWGIAGFMGIQALGFYTMLSWLPSVLRDAGASTATASLALVLFNLLGISTSLAVPPLATRLDSQAPVAVVVAVSWGTGLVGLMLWPENGLVWSVVLGFGQGAGVSLAMTLMSLKASTSDVARQLSGMCQGFGYTVAATGPFLVGWLRDQSSGWTLPLGFMACLAVVMAVAGAVGGRAGHVR